jgi:hypothetical protein
MKKFKAILIGINLVFTIGVFAPLLTGITVSAADEYGFQNSMKISGEGSQTKRAVFSRPAICGADKTGEKLDPADGITYSCEEPIVPQVVSIIMYIVGIISVIMLISAGIMYATSAGDEAKMKKAKGAIIAAIIGLVIALLAWTLVNFVFSAIK